MRKRIAVLLSVLVVAAASLTAVALAGSSASPMKFKAVMTAAQEVPKPKGVPAGAGGTFTATLKGTTLQWTLTFHGLSGGATAAHIHMGAKGKPGPVIVALCGSACKSPVSGATLVSASVAKSLESGKTYVNVHTTKNPNGEIRGQLGM